MLTTPEDCMPVCDADVRSHQWEVRFTNLLDLPGRALPAGFPLVVDTSTGVLCEPALEFLYRKHFKLKAKQPVINTLVSYAYDLKEWFQYLDEFCLSWDEVKHSDIVGFAKAMRATVSPETGKTYSAKTIKRRASTVISLYRWALRSAYRFVFSPQVSISLDEAIQNRRNISPEPDAEEKQHVSLIHPAQAKVLMECIGKLPSSFSGGHFLRRCLDRAPKSELALFDSSRNRLAVQIGLSTGLRISEVCSLKLRTFHAYLDREHLADTQIVKITVKGKGGKSRQVDFSGILINEIVAYASQERKGVIVASGRGEPPELLLNPLTSGRFAGLRTTPRTLERAFSMACIKSGYKTYETYEQVGDDGAILGAAQREVPDFVFHDVRHTFAIWTYYARKRKGDAEPWLYIQQQLGHTFLETTLKIYLAAAQDFEAVISDKLIKHLNG